MTALDERPPTPDPTGVSPAVMPDRTSLPLTTVIRPRTCATCTRNDPAGRDRARSHVTYLTAAGTLAGGTTVRSDITTWIDRQTARGWTVLHHDPATGAAALTRPDGSQQLIEPRITP